MSNRHFIIPDTQVKAGVPLEHLEWVAQAINEYKPNVVVHLGDHWDMSSVSTHTERGSLDKEGERIYKDLECGNEAMRILSKTRHKPSRKILLRGNHENRLNRYVSSHPELEGLVGEHLFHDEKYGWEVVRYNNGSPLAIKVDGVYYAHYFANPNTGRAISGNINNRLNYIGNSFVQGHQQGLILGSKQLATGKTLQGISAGSCYIHDEPYKGMANAHWRGVVVLNEVEDGGFAEMPLSLNYLCQKYEGVPLAIFLRKKYKKRAQEFSLSKLGASL